MASHILHSDADLAAALAVLAEADPRLAKLIDIAGHPALPRRLAGRRPRLAGGGAPGVRTRAPSREQGHDRTRRAMASMARSGGAPLVDLLSCAQTARCRAG